MKGDSVVYQTVINSGIFRLDEKGEPIGLIELTAQKRLSRNKTVEVENLFNLIADLAQQLETYQHSPTQDELKSWQDTFIIVYGGEIRLMIKSAGLNPQQLEPHFSRLIRKMHSLFGKRLKEGSYQGLTGPKNLTFKKTALTELLVKIFQVYTPFNNLTATRWHIAHLLHGTGLEAGSVATIYNRIKKWHSRKGQQVLELNLKYDAVLRKITKIKQAEN